MGTRLEIYVKDLKTAEDMVAISKAFNVEADIIGRVVHSDSNLSKVVIKQGEAEVIL